MTEKPIGVPEKFADQVQRTFAVERIKGWKFHEDKCDVGVLLMSWTPESYAVKARLDDVVLEGTIKTTSEATDVARMVDTLVGTWLVRHADEKPARQS